MSRGPQVGGLTTEPLPSRGSPTLHNLTLSSGLKRWGPPIRYGAPPVSFGLKTWIWQGHHLGSRMARVE